MTSSWPDKSKDPLEEDGGNYALGRLAYEALCESLEMPVRPDYRSLSLRAQWAWTDAARAIADALY